MKELILVFVVFIFPLSLTAQDLMDILDAETPVTKNYATAFFKGSRIINAHSIENREKNSLEFIIAHRFGSVNGGAYELFGIDQANVRFALEYALSDNITLGAGRSSFRKTYDGFVKYRFLRQQSGIQNVPFSLSALASINAETVRDYDPVISDDFSAKLAYTYQLLLARKFSTGFSAQLIPSLVHRNFVADRIDGHDIFALGAGGRLKITQRLALNIEYHYVFNPVQAFETYNSFAVGFDIETGGHVFQLHFTNSQSMVEKGFITETVDDFFNGDIHFGFNITRTFHLNH